MKTEIDHKYKTGDIVQCGEDIFRIYSTRVTNIEDEEPQIEYNVNNTKSSNKNPKFIEEHRLRLVAQCENCL